MAQNGFTPISIYYSTTASAVPTAANLVPGELAINTNDGKLYYEDSSGVVQTLASKAGALGDVVGPASATDNALARFDLTTGKLIQNSVGILSDAGILTGLTGITSSGSITFSSLTSGRVTYATTAGLLTDSANLLYSGTDLTVYGVRVGRGAGAVASNTVLGNQAGNSNTTGSNNVYIGNTAGINATGSNNVFVGKDTGYGYLATNTGNNNTLIGNSAGFYMTSGNKNTIIGNYSGNNSGLDISTSSNYVVLSDGDGVPKAVFDNGNQFLLGTVTNTTNGGFVFATDFYGAGRSTQIIGHINGASSGDAYMVFNYNGTGIGSITQVGTSATAYNSTSDYRLKENIVPMTGALAKVAQLKPVTYKWKTNGSNGQGFIAHELAEVIPDCVTGEKDATKEEQYEITPAIQDEKGRITTPAEMGTRTVPVYQGVDTSFLVATLVSAIQELKADFDVYKASHP